MKDVSSFNKCLFFLGKETFKVKISPLNEEEYIRVHVPPPLDRGDGSFLMRYRLYGSALKGLKVEIFHQDVAVAKSPYIIQGVLLFFFNLGYQFGFV